MYSPTTRLLAVLELLLAHREISGTELAERLEVDRRTVRRYITTLQDMGIPVEGERGPYGAYRLTRGYKLPPLMFTEAEAVALTLGLVAMRQFQFPVEIAAVEGTLAKIERVLPEKLLGQVRGLQESIIFNESSYLLARPPILHNHTLATLSLAAQQKQQVYLRYEAGNGGISERTFDPYGIVFNAGWWYTAGYCHLRHDLRTFRLDRITQLEILTTTFERPDDFDTLKFVIASLTTQTGAPQIEVILKTSLEHAQEYFPAFTGTLEPSNDGIRFRRSAIQLEWIAHILLSVDFPAVIVENDELRRIVRSYATKAHELLGEF